MSRVFMRIKTDDGPRTIVLSAASLEARMIADNLDYEAITILPDIAACLPVAVIVANRDKKLAQEIARKARRRRTPQTELFLASAR